MKLSLDRRIDALETAAPSGLSRPDGLSGTAFIDYALLQLEAVSALPDREWAWLASAYLRMMTRAELRRLNATLEGAVLRHRGADATGETLDSTWESR